MTTAPMSTKATSAPDQINVFGFNCKYREGQKVPGPRGKPPPPGHEVFKNETLNPTATEAALSLGVFPPFDVLPNTCKALEHLRIVSQ